MGHIYVAPPGHHLVVKHDFVRVVRGPKENRARPAVDPLFRSAAYAYGPRTIGVLLTGNLDDGTAGMVAIKRRSGIAIVQDPNEAFFPSMPLSALNHVAVDYCLPLVQIPPLLAQLVLAPADDEEAYPISKALAIEAGLPAMKEATMEKNDVLGTPSMYTCPECQGTLWEIHDGELLRFRCHIGHAYSIETLLSEQAEALEGAMWVALRALEEKIHLSQRLADRARQQNQSALANRYASHALDLELHAQQIKQALETSEKLAQTSSLG